MQTHVSLEQEGDLGILTFACDEPGKPATLDLRVLDELEEGLKEIRSRVEELRAVVVRSDCDRYFIVGANINALQTLDAATIVHWVQRGHAVFDQLESLPLPVIARVEGYALGGGLELALACDLIVASREAKLGQPEASLGFVAGWGGSYRLPRRIGVTKAKELFFTARIVDAEEACEMGLVDFCGERAEVERYLESLFEGVRSCSPLAISEMKKLIHRSLHISLRESCLEEAVASSACLSSGDTRARVAAFLESRKKKRTE